MPDYDYIISARAVRNGHFGDGIAPSSYLAIPEGEKDSPEYKIARTQWFKRVREAAAWKNDKREDRGDVLFIVHGFDNSDGNVLHRHRRLKADLGALGFNGVVVSFDWPSGHSVFGYLSDRHTAKKTALRLMSDGITHLAKQQEPNCPINVHVLGHSMGAFVIRDAFDDADDSHLVTSSWNISQLMLAAGDISSKSMAENNAKGEAIYRHCIRLTNYFNHHDEALDASNIKRLGTAPRLGRIGLPADAPAKAVNVNCTRYYAELTTDHGIEAADQPHGFDGFKSHSWYFGNRAFTVDLFCTMVGRHRTVVPTRDVAADGTLWLRQPPPGATIP